MAVLPGIIFKRVSVGVHLRLLFPDIDLKPTIPRLLCEDARAMWMEA